MKSIKSFLALAFIVVMASACETRKTKDEAELAETANDAKFDDRSDEQDAEFIVEVLASNYAEIKLAQLAQNRFNDSRLKDVAQKLETDHSRIVDELKSYADKKRIIIPNEETNEDKEKISDLSDESDPNKFDEQWCKVMKNKHESTINKLESYMDKTEDVDLKNWIAQTLPTIQNHLEEITKNKERVN